MHTGKLFCGPCVSVDQLLKVCKVEDIATLVKEKMHNDISIAKAPGKILYLDIAPQDKPAKKVIIRSGRVGLHMTKPVAKIAAELQYRYVLKPYRYLLPDKRINKGRNYMILQLLLEGKKEAEIVSLIGCTADNVTKVFQLYEQGKKYKPDDFLGKKMTDDDLCLAFASIYGNK